MGNVLTQTNRRTESETLSKIKMKSQENKLKTCIAREEVSGKRDGDQTPASFSPRSKSEGRICSKKPRTSGKRESLGSERDSIKNETRKAERKNHVPKKEQYLKCFLKLFDDEIIQDFMWNDGCAKLLDKYLLAMVYVYFRRAELSTKQYNRINFFAALFLAHDMEEDDEEIKQEIFPWAFGSRWKTCYPLLVKRKDDLLKKMNFRSVVSNLTCLEVFALWPEHPLWQRERQWYHGGATRLYPPEDELPYDPRGPRRSPVFCDQCSIHAFGEVEKRPFPSYRQSSSVMLTGNKTSKRSKSSSKSDKSVHDHEE